MQVVVHLSVDSKDETAQATYEEFLRRCRDQENAEHIEIKVITPDLLQVEKSENRELSMAKALEKLVNTKKQEKTKNKKEEALSHHHLPKVFLLQNYPATEEELFALMDRKFKYPVLDGVIRIVKKTESALISSEGGPPSTIPRDPEDQPRDELVTDLDGEPSHSKKHLLSELDLAGFLEKHHSKHFGHITFDEINSVKPSGDKKNPWVTREFANIFDEFTVLTSALAESKHVFREWASQTFLVDVKHDAKAAKRIASARSGDRSVWKSEPLYSAYLEHMSLIPPDLQSPVGVMFCMIHALAAPEEDSLSDPFGFSPKPGISPSFKTYEAASMAESPSENQILSDLVYEPAPATVPEPILVIEDGDRSAIRAILARRHTLDSADPSQSSDRPETSGSPRATSPMNDRLPVLPLAAKKSCLEMISFESTVLFHAQVPRLIGQTALPLRPSYSRLERSIMEAELLTFTELSSSDVHRFNLLQTAEQMVERILPKLPNFTGQKISEMLEEISITKRHHFRHIPASTLSQQLARDLQADPVILREYYPLTDQLLLAYLWIPPHRRLHQKDCKLSSFMRVKPTYEEFRILREKENYTPRTASGLKHTINITAAELERHSFHKSVLTPSDNSLVSLTAMTGGGSGTGVDPWLSIATKDAVIGMRAKGGTGSAGGGNHHHHEQMGSDHEEHSAHRSLHRSSSAGEAIFFCHGEDDVRITAAVESSIPAERVTRKPDGKSFVRVTLTDSNGLLVVVNSDGLVAMTPPDCFSPSPSSGQFPFGMEKQRMVLTGGVVCRILHSEYLYSRDILMPDGSRIIVRGAGVGSSDGSDKSKKGSKTVRKAPSRIQTQPSSAKKTVTTGAKGGGWDPSETKEIFLAALIRDAPEDWSYLHLTAQGAVHFYQTTAGGAESNGSRRLPFERVKNICKRFLDGESKSEVLEFRDGRVVINFANEDLREVRHADGTRQVTHLLRNTVFTEKQLLPSVEMDLEVDRMCRQHSRGLQVPIAKGGERVRARVAMPDGTAVFIKYNTRVTALFNGSLRVVKSSKDSFLLEDGGVLTYFPAASWSPEREKEFQDDSLDSAMPRHTPFQTNKPPPSEPAAAAASASVAQKSTRAKATGASLSRKPLPPTKTKALGLPSDSALRDSIATKAPVATASPPVLVTPPVRPDTHISVPVDNTRYVFRLSVAQCVIEDHENNVFELSFSSPLQPKVSLAGEVEGLKPKAITEKTLEAKLYIVSRHGHAVQVVGGQEMEDLSVAMKLSRDSLKYLTEARSPPCDLGGAQLHTFFKRRRVGAEDAFVFSEVFSHRFWHHFQLPSAASIILDKAKKRPMASTSLRQKVYEVRNTIEYPPLSKQGYGGLADSFKRWSKWRVERNTALDRFHFHDPRTEEELKAEKEIASRLKKAYRAAKAMVNKKKEKEREREKALASQQQAQGKGQGHDQGTNLDLSALREERAHLDDIPENNSDYEDEDEEDEEAEFVEDPESVEIKESFENYAVAYEDSVSRLPLSSLRSAFVQVFNRFIPEADIQEGLKDDIRSASSRKDSLTIEEYRRLYFKLKGPDGLESASSRTRLSENDRSARDPPPARLATTVTFSAPAKLSTGSDQRGFWSSHYGQQLLEQEEQKLEDGGESEDLLGRQRVSYQISGGAVGSALSAARSVNRLA